MNDSTDDCQRKLRELEQVYRRVEELEAQQEELLEEQATLCEQVEEYRTAFEFAGDSIFVLDASGTKILDANSNAARRLGYAQDELLAVSYKDIEVLPDDSMSWESVISSTLVYECDFRRKDGSMTPVEVSSRPVILGSKQLVHNVVRDISWRKAAQMERERLIEDLEAFSYTVAHDLKGPLHLITGFADVLEASVTDGEDGERLQAIVRSARKMDEIIEGLLLLAHVRTQEDWSTDVLEMGSVVAEALEHQAHLTHAFEPNVSLPDEWPAALGYAPWVGEVWMNYISNAIKYGGDPPQVELGFDRQAEGRLRFWVRDNGPGLTQEEKDQLFAPFIRLGAARTSNVKSYGLGLSIVRRIVEKLGGEAGVDSAPGKGSTFWFTLPAVE